MTSGGFSSAVAFVVLIASVVVLVECGVRRLLGAVSGPGRHADTTIEIGTVRGSRRPAYLTLAELQQGLLIGGAPGSGKTTGITTLASRLPPKIGFLLIDMKGDQSLPGKVGVPRDRVFGTHSKADARWSPLSSGDAGSWRDVLMATQEWTEPHYRQAASRYLGAVLGALQKARPIVLMDHVVRMTESPARLKGLLSELPDCRERDVLAQTYEVFSNDASLRSGVVGLSNRLALLCDSPATGTRFGSMGGIDLEGIFSGERAVFSLPAASYPDEAPAIAAAVVASFCAAGQRLARGDEPLKAVLIIDEAPRLGGIQLREAVAVGRGAGIGSVVAVQDFADLDYIEPGTREAVETGASTWLVMRQVASAEDIANSLGTRLAKQRTVQKDAFRIYSDTGMRSEREVHEYRVSPNSIRGLGTGEAVLCCRLDGRLERIQIARSEHDNDEEVSY